MTPFSGKSAFLGVIALFGAAMTSTSLPAQPTDPAAEARLVEEGVQAWRTGNHNRAVELWRPLAMRGNADASFNLGQAYRLGRGVPPNLGEAQRYFEAAAQKGHVEAQTNLGLIMFNNGERAAAMRWLKEAAIGNEPRAMLVYGTALFNGEGVPQDHAAAYAYVLRAARAGLGPAQATLSEMNSLLPIDVKQAGRAMADGQAGEAAPEPVKVAEAPPPAPPPPPPPAPKAAPAPVADSADGPWRLQLGAFSKADGARTLWRKLDDHPALAGKRPYYEPAGNVTRLQVGGFASRASAISACERLKSSGQACFALRPN